MTTKAILFDLDGTLVDSVPLWIEANLRALKVLHVHIDADTFLKTIYHRGLHYHGILEQCGIGTEHAERFYGDRNDRFADLLRKKVQWIGDAENTVRRCAAKAPLGMLTGSKRRFIDAMDARLHLSSLFSAIITYDETGRRMKPDPYGLLLLTEHLNVAPEDCMYVGDQHVDVEAAKNAHMSSCLLKRTETPEGAEQGADFVIDTIEKLLQILQFSDMNDQSDAWVKTIEEEKGYQMIDAASFKTLIGRMGGYAFFQSIIRHVRPGQSVLEAGCGWALASFALAERGVKATAADISDKLVQDLKRVQERLGSPFAQNLKVVTQDIFRLTEMHERFDAIISDGTYEHFLQDDERRTILKNFRSVLKPNGLVIIAVPNLHNPFFGSVVDERMPAMHPFTIRELSAELERGGFRVIETGCTFVNPGFAQWVQAKWMISAIRLAGAVFGFLPRPLKRIVAAHLYCIAQAA